MISKVILNQNFIGKNLGQYCFSLKNAAIILSGNGVQDGSEVTEVVSLYIALNKNNIHFQCYAPNSNQFHVINHLKGEEQKQSRNVLEESARIARGNVKDLKDLLTNSSNYQAIFLPGGFGAAKNLSSFGYEGDKMSVIPDLENILKKFHQDKKIIGACCISPIILAKIFGNVQITLGCKGDNWPFGGSIEVAQSFGAITKDCFINETHTDINNKIVTAPAFMYDTNNFYQIYKSVEKMVESAIEIA